MRRAAIFVLAILLAAPAFATEANPTVRQRELIDKLMQVTGMDTSLNSVMDAMWEQMEKQFFNDGQAQGQSEEALAEGREMFQAFRKKAATVNFTEMLRESFVRIYAKYFTEEEIADLIAFYQTPTGRKSMQIMPQLMSEGMQAASVDLGPKMDQLMAEVTVEHEKKRPWRRTMADFRSIYTALAAYSLDNDEKYPLGSYEKLREVLTPTYIKTLPEKDIWGHPYAYVVSPDQKHFRLVSAGADGIFDWDSRRITPLKEDEEIVTRYRDRLEDDLIFADYEFMQLPVQAQPREEQ
jgi:uncharacterized protein